MKNDVLNSRFVEYTLICGCPLISSGLNDTFFFNNGLERLNECNYQ